LDVGERAETHPCFVVFDILQLNGVSMLTSPLAHRYGLLKTCIQPKPQYLEILNYKEASTTAEVMASLDEHMISHEEGLIIKDPESPYVLNDRGGSWLKLKPDYIDSLGDDLDLLLIGGFFGTGRRARMLSHFMCAVIDDSSPQRRYMSFCKFGTGYTIAEIDDIAREAEGHWKPYNTKKPPEWFIHPPDSKERPDMIIAPEHSRVITVKAAEIVKSEQYATQLTLRFPRFVKLRLDKDVEDALTYHQLLDYFDRNNGRMQSRKHGAVSERKDRQRGTFRRLHTQATVSAEYRPVNATGITQESDIFGGLEFSIIPGATQNEDSGMEISKHDLERLVLQYGGSVVQNPRPGKTKYVVADRMCKSL
jgi:DNA ligase-4